MSGQPFYPDLAREGLELWTNGNLQGAEAKYREALARISSGHAAVPHVRLQLAHVLAARGCAEEARSQFELALTEELSLAENETDLAVRIARYFLAQHLLKLGEPQAALAAIEPAVGFSGDFALRMVESEVRQALGQHLEAMTALRFALESAKTDEQRSDVRQRIALMEQQGKHAG